MRVRLCTVLLVMLGACGTAGPKPSPSPAATRIVPAAPAAAQPTAAAAPPPAAAPVPVQLTAKSYPLPGATGPVTLDYIAYDRGRARLWVPVGNTGSADVFDPARSTFTAVTGFKTAEREVRGAMRVMGPSAVTIGDGFVYVGNRATGEVCAIEQRSLKLGKCLRLPTSTDGVVYVSPTKEVWVTTPRDGSLTILDASKPAALAPKLVLKTDGEPEGYAVDADRGLFYTNLEDKNRTLVIDVKTHAVRATWSPACGADGPRGVSIDTARNLLFVACTDHVQVLDAGHDGARLGTLDTGAGVDNLDYDPATKLLYVAARKAGRLTVARIDDQGRATIVALGKIAEGARNAAVDASGNVYVAEPDGARLLVFAAPVLP
jgi:DNA-binding beta-propeller fold protein YncE